MGGGYTFWANNAVVTDFLKNSSHHLPPKPTTYSTDKVLMAKFGPQSPLQVFYLGQLLETVSCKSTISSMPCRLVVHSEHVGCPLQYSSLILPYRNYVLGYMTTAVWSQLRPILESSHPLNVQKVFMSLELHVLQIPVY